MCIWNLVGVEVTKMILEVVVIMVMMMMMMMVILDPVGSTVRYEMMKLCTGSA